MYHATGGEEEEEEEEKEGRLIFCMFELSLILL